MEPKPTTGQPLTPRRASKAKARDYTDPYRHGHRAKGGPIERRWVKPEPTEKPTKD